MSVFTSEPVAFQLRDGREQHIVLLVKSAPFHPIGQDFLANHDTHIAFSQKGKCSPDQVAQLVGVSAHTPRGSRFNS